MNAASATSVLPELQPPWAVGATEPVEPPPPVALPPVVVEPAPPVLVLPLVPVEDVEPVEPLLPLVLVVVGPLSLSVTCPHALGWLNALKPIQSVDVSAHASVLSSMATSKPKPVPALGVTPRLVHGMAISTR